MRELRIAPPCSESLVWLVLPQPRVEVTDNLLQTQQGVVAYEVLRTDDVRETC